MQVYSAPYCLRQPRARAEQWLCGHVLTHTTRSVLTDAGFWPGVLEYAATEDQVIVYISWGSGQWQPRVSNCVPGRVPEAHSLNPWTPHLSLPTVIRHIFPLPLLI